MKRLICLFLILLTALMLVCCAPLDERAPEQDAEQQPEQSSEAPSAPTFILEQAVAAFDTQKYFIQTYDETMIESIRAKLTLQGDIVAVVHVTNPATAVPDLEWTYIYEFSNETDAIAFEENRTSFVSTQEGGRCLRRGLIVIYGNSPLIGQIEG